MQDIPDNELDKLFKDSAGLYDNSLEEASWLKMKERLDLDKKKKIFYNKTLLSLVLLIGVSFSSGIGYYVYTLSDEKQNDVVKGEINIADKNANEIKPESSIKENSQVREHKVLLATEPMKSVSGTSKGKTLGNLLDRESVKKDNFGNASSQYRRESIPKRKSVNNAAIQRHLSNTENVLKDIDSEDKINTVGINNKKSVSDYDQKEQYQNKDDQKFLVSETNTKSSFKEENPIDKNGSFDNFNNQSNEAIINNNDKTDDSSKSIAHAIPVASSDLSGNNTLKVGDTNMVAKPVIEDSILTVSTNTPVDTTASAKGKSKKEREPRFRRFSIGVLVSPDFSFIGLSQLSRPGMGEGIFVEYHLTSRWTINIGGMLTSKIYSSDYEGYGATTGFWTAKSKPDVINGSCNVLDIPINVKYYYLHRSKNLLYTSAGLSSYFMLKERYSFVYSNTEKSWDYGKGQNYYFSVINFSLGYERYIGKAFSVQVEPFIKVPINSIGEGKVKLLTAGVYFCLKYNIR